MWCSNCGVSGEKARLVDVISPEGIVKLCTNCSDKEDLPVVKRPTTEQLKMAEKPAYYGRYSRGSNVKETGRRIEGFGKPGYSDNDVDVKLRDIVDKNYRERVPTEKKPRPDMVDNFHWIIMRARRLKKMTQKELAKEISEAEAAIEMAEKGILPEDDYKLVNKLESYFGVSLVKDGARRMSRTQTGIEREPPVRILNVDNDKVKTLTIDDLKRMKKEREQGLSEPLEKKSHHDYQEEIEVSEEDYVEFEEEE